MATNEQQVSQLQVVLGPYDPGQAVGSALEKDSAAVLQTIRDSGLRGRGGAGFPTGLKWSMVAEEKADQKYVICNADEGEPGTFKDRVLLQDYADLVFDGMVVCAYAVGATKGFLYLRAEYRYLYNHLQTVLQRMQNEGRLGRSIGGRKGFDFDIEIRLGSGAYVCGEETALIESMEGKPGEPRNRPPFPVTSGYMGKPTVVNNVETFAQAARIVVNGADWFRSLGTEQSTGVKLFSVSGDCRRPGVYELPLGITIRGLLQMVGAEDAIAVQVGGAAGICVPRKNFDRKLAFEDVPTGGSVIVFGPHRDLLHVLENFLEFFTEESCGHCTPCRVGTSRLLEGVRAMRNGTLSEADLQKLCRLAETMGLAAKCGLGQSVRSPFLSVLQACGRLS